MVHACAISVPLIAHAYAISVPHVAHYLRIRYLSTAHRPAYAQPKMTYVVPGHVLARMSADSTIR
eukprot:3122569-Rhodomonas_salina.3